MTAQTRGATVVGHTSTGAPCTMCGRQLGAFTIVTTKRGDAVLYCTGCGKRGVSCDCPPVEGYRTIQT